MLYGVLGVVMVLVGVGVKFVFLIGFVMWIGVDLVGNIFGILVVLMLMVIIFVLLIMVVVYGLVLINVMLCVFWLLIEDM